MDKVSRLFASGDGEDPGWVRLNELPGSRVEDRNRGRYSSSAGRKTEDTHKNPINQIQYICWQTHLEIQKN